jgi:putative ATPase
MQLCTGLARMIEGGEDVKFIARRLVILASEDIGNANPTALVMANATFEAVNKIGYPNPVSSCRNVLLI